MKVYLKLVIIAIFIGSILAFWFYKDLKNEVKALTSTENSIYLYQVGVFKEKNNALKYKENFSSSIIYYDKPYYRVIIGLTINNKEKLEKYFQDQGYDYYIKRVDISKNYYDEIKTYDAVLTKSDNYNVINSILTSMEELFLESMA